MTSPADNHYLISYELCGEDYPLYEDFWAALHRFAETTRVDGTRWLVLSAKPASQIAEDLADLMHPEDQLTVVEVDDDEAFDLALLAAERKKRPPPEPQSTFRDELIAIETHTWAADGGEFRMPDPAAVARVSEAEKWIAGQIAVDREPLLMLIQDEDEESSIRSAGFARLVRSDGPSEVVRVLFRAHGFEPTLMLSVARDSEDEFELLTVLYNGSSALSQRLLELKPGEGLRFLLDRGCTHPCMIPQMIAELPAREAEVADWVYQFPKFVGRLPIAARDALLARAAEDPDDVQAGEVAIGVATTRGPDDPIPAGLSEQLRRGLSASDRDQVRWRGKIASGSVREYVAAFRGLGTMPSAKPPQVWAEAVELAARLGRATPFGWFDEFANDPTVVMAGLGTDQKLRIVQLWPPTFALAWGLLQLVGEDTKYSPSGGDWAKAGFARLEDDAIADAFVSKFPLHFSQQGERGVAEFVDALSRPSLNAAIAARFHAQADAEQADGLSLADATRKFATWFETPPGLGRGNIR